VLKVAPWSIVNSTNSATLNSFVNVVFSQIIALKLNLLILQFYWN